jgi:hypothetical protein
MPYGSEFVEATIVEDHGNLGAGGKRLYGVRFRVDSVTDEIYTDREADRLTLVSRAAAQESERKNGAPE